MNRSIIVLIILLMATTVGAMAQSDADRICGKWLSADQSSHIEVYQKAGKYYAKVVWLKEPKSSDGTPKTDQNNPDPSLRSRPILGLDIISDLQYSQGKWTKGSLYSPKNGQTGNCTLALAANGDLAVTVSKSFFSTTKIWTRL